MNTVLRPLPQKGHTEAMATNSERSELPWTHRQNRAVRLLLCMAAGIASAVVGTLAHRMGAEQNVPYGLVLALAIIGLSTWCARSRSGAVGLAVHLVFSSITAWGMAAAGPGGDAITPIGFGGSVPFMSEHAGYIWLVGMLVIQLVLLVLPGRWFVLTSDGNRDAPSGARRSTMVQRP
jgi:hypothetical protein